MLKFSMLIAHFNAQLCLSISKWQCEVPQKSFRRNVSLQMTHCTDTASLFSVNEVFCIRRISLVFFYNLTVGNFCSIVG